MITIAVPWQPGFFADQHRLRMLGCESEVWECADYAGREWASWWIDNEYGERIGRGSAATVEEAQAVVSDLIRDRWNARCAAAS